MFSTVDIDNLTYTDRLWLIHKLAFDLMDASQGKDTILQTEDIEISNTARVWLASIITNGQMINKKYNHYVGGMQFILNYDAVGIWDKLYIIYFLGQDLYTQFGGIPSPDCQDHYVDIFTELNDNPHWAYTKLCNFVATLVKSL